MIWIGVIEALPTHRPGGQRVVKAAGEVRLFS